MKSILTPALLCLALAAPLASPSLAATIPQAKPADVALTVALPADPIQVEMSAPKERYLGGEPVILTVVLRNNTLKPVSFLMLGPKYELVVRYNSGRKRGKGKQVLLFTKGKEDSTGEEIAEHIVGPSESWQYKIVLNRLFDMSRAGTYTVLGHKDLKMENPTPGGSLVGARKPSGDLKLTVSEDDVTTGPS